MAESNVNKETKDPNREELEFSNLGVEFVGAFEFEKTVNEQIEKKITLEMAFEQDKELKRLMKYRKKLLTELKKSSDSSTDEKFLQSEKELNELDLIIEEKRQYIIDHHEKREYPNISMELGANFVTRKEQERFNAEKNGEVQFSPDELLNDEDPNKSKNKHSNDDNITGEVLPKKCKKIFNFDQIEDDGGGEQSKYENGAGEVYVSTSCCDSMADSVDDMDQSKYISRINKFIEKSQNEKLRATNIANPNLINLNGDYFVDRAIYNLLFEHQKVAVRWLWELYRQEAGGILGDEMGLGKTLDIIAFFQGLFLSGLLTGPALIVCPATVVNHWLREFHRWAPIFRVVIGFRSLLSDPNFSIGDRVKKCWRFFNVPNELRTIREKFDLKPENVSLVLSRANYASFLGHSPVVMITTYQSCRMHIDAFKSIEWSCCVMDEGHKLRNPSTALSIACKQIETRYKVILTGTPIQNNLEELWSLFDFCFPGKLGTLETFEENFVVPIKSGSYFSSSEAQIRIAYQCALVLHDLVLPYLLRRSKDQVELKLPEKNEQILLCKLSPQQEARYLDFLKSREVKLIYGGKMNMLYGIDILRKVCNHTWLLEGDHGESNIRNCVELRELTESSCKLELISHILKQWHGQTDPPSCVLLFVQTLQMMEIIEKFLVLSGYLFLRMDGSVPVKKRQELIDRFNESSSNIFVFLLTTRVGGLGLNLTRANRVIIFDPDWNPTTDVQAKERTYRIGQKNRVTIYRLITSGTIEEKVYHRQIYKQFLTNRVLNDPKKSRSFFNHTRIKELFKLERSSNCKVYEAREGDSLQTDEKSAREGDLQMDGKSDWILGKILGNGKNSNIIKCLNHEEIMEKANCGSKLASKMCENEAKKVAELAAESLKNSYVSKSVVRNLFGKTRKTPTERAHSLNTGFSSTGLISSKEIKDSLKKLSSHNDNDVAQSTLSMLLNFLKQKPNNSATSDELVQRFKDIEPSELLIFREVLRQIASFNPKDSTWRLHSWAIEK